MKEKGNRGKSHICHSFHSASIIANIHDKTKWHQHIY